MKKNLELIRLRGEMTCNQFAPLLGVSNVSLLNYESGRSEPSYSTWLRMKNVAKSNGIELDDHIFCEGIKKGGERIVLITDSLQTVREHLGWTRKQMGEVMGVSEHGYARYERGEREPLASAWLKLKYCVQSYGIHLLENRNAEGCV